MTTVKKVTKREKFGLISEMMQFAEEQGYALPETCTYEDLQEFVDNEIKLLDNKTAAAQKRQAEKRAAGDELREKVFAVLPTDEFITIAEIVKRLDNADISPQSVTSRLTQLKDAGRVEKDSITVKDSDGKNKKLSAYKAIL